MCDKTFYDRFIWPYEERMMACAWRIVREREGVKDAVQDTLVAIWRKRDLVAKHPNPEALVLRICRECAIDQVRRTARRSLRETAVPDLPESRNPTLETPLSRMCDDESSRMVRQAIAALPGKQSLAVIMRIVEEVSYAEVAAALDCSEATARTHVKRGRERLRQDLNHLVGA